MSAVLAALGPLALKILASFLTGFLVPYFDGIRADREKAASDREAGGLDVANRTNAKVSEIADAQSRASVNRDSDDALLERLRRGDRL